MPLSQQVGSCPLASLQGTVLVLGLTVQPMGIAPTATKQALLGHPSKSLFILAWVLLGVAGLWLRLTRHVCVWGGAEAGPGLVVAGAGLRLVGRAWIVVGGDRFWLGMAGLSLGWGRGAPTSSCR